MRLSKYFLPVLKEIPKEAEIVSHRLMLRAGMIRQSSAGIYNWLPLGLNVMQRISDIVRQEQNRAGAVEILMPTLQPAELWRESGRYDDYGEEMLRISDRQQRQLLYGPTNEEAITAIVRSSVTSWRNLPQMLYHIQWKFRDEIRPRFGVMRGREFLMKDAYSFDLNQAESKKSYNRMFIAYLRTYARMGLKPIPMRAATGPIGGDLSHEFIVLAETGESQVYCDKQLLDFPIPTANVDFESDLEPLVSKWTNPYAATDEMHDQKVFEDTVKSENQVQARGIEVGQLFYFGTKYSEPMKAAVQDNAGDKVSMHMGSYGVGISRLVAAIIETSHDDKGIIWPDEVAPYLAGIVQLRNNDDLSAQLSEKIYNALTNIGVSVLWDDTAESAGGKFSRMDLIGLPYQVIIGPKAAEIDQLELKIRSSHEVIKLSSDEIIKWFENKS